MKSLFEYFDYRDFLKDHYEWGKQKHDFFSFRYIAAKTGLDASFYVKVLQKQMHLSNRSIDSVCTFLKFNKMETEYFSLLVQFNKAKQKEGSKRLFEKLLEFKEPRTNTLETAQYEFFSKWYYIAIRELLNYYPFRGDFADLAARLNPPIKKSEAKTAINLLLKLSLIKIQDDGSYVPCDQFVSTGESWKSMAIENFQQETIKLAGESITRIPKTQRETSTVTVSMSWKCLQIMKERLREMRKELLEIARQDDTPEGVFQVNFQIFPLTQNPEEK
ncbi:TIGR02147 family protein [Chitinispirillales bacterium ANBcel5]|uniref:TIGR02147 family protein n=1 Tax=Cellulosispirillum alkaliphilum TaxID=3039283 RepID=UPI002A4FA741|nr:TIGR02147 family protein [Chitinispirillales bacterium ANBcel5]